MGAGPDEARRMLSAGVDLFMRTYLFPRPVVAACTGHAIAAGSIILMSTDVRIGAAGDFRIGLPEVTIGMPLPFFATELARDRISKRHLSQVFLGRMYDPEGATDAGFLDEVVDAEAARPGPQRREPWWPEAHPGDIPGGYRRRHPGRPGRGPLPLLRPGLTEADRRPAGPQTPR